MQPETFIITGYDADIREALDATEKLGAESGLDRKENLRLRLLGEELLGLVRGIAGKVEARYWPEREDKAFRLHLLADIPMTQEMRRQFIGVSTTGTNEAVKGFTGKLREMIANLLLPRDDNPSYLSLGLMSMGSPGGFRASEGSYEWSMSQYKAEVKRGENGDEEHREAWDALEKSVIAKLADEVRISITGSRVEIVVDKRF